MKILICPNCQSASIKKNGFTSYGKQNYFCNSCGRQFVEKGSDWFISKETIKIVDNLLLERISLAGICRSTGISKSWLLSYIKDLYSELPDDLSASTDLPDLEDYLEERFDEEISRIEKVKKILIHLRTTK